MIVVVGKENDLDYPCSMRFCPGGNKVAQRLHICACGHLCNRLRLLMEDCPGCVKEDKVVVLMELDFQGVSREDVEALSNEMRARENPPAGLIAHVVTDTANGVHAVDIWESAADFQRFAQEQLMPSIKKVSHERGLLLPDPPPEPKITEAYDLIRVS